MSCNQIISCNKQFVVSRTKDGTIDDTENLLESQLEDLAGTRFRWEDMWIGSIILRNLIRVSQRFREGNVLKFVPKSIWT